MDSLFKDKVRKIVEDNVEKFKSKTSNTNNYKDFSNSLDQEVNSVLTDVLQEVHQRYKPENYKTKELFVEDVLEKCSILITQRSHRVRRFDRLLNSYQVKHVQHEALTDEIKQAIKHDWYDKLRFLLFRILTTIGIAGAAIGMAMFAQTQGYETVLIKKKSPVQKAAEVIKVKELTQAIPVKPKAKVITQALSTVQSTTDSK
ncbi:MAG: hypothetical protein QNK36_08870 [Colwellia sp.]|nr:hypothetical protein [Colwellia sp.]